MLNLFVYDILVLVNYKEVFPQSKSLGFRIFNYTLPVTNFISQYCLYLILAKHEEQLKRLMCVGLFRIDKRLIDSNDLNQTFSDSEVEQS